MIRESLNPCVNRMLLLPNKNGEWRMCDDSRALGKITIKYGFLITTLNDLLNNLHGASLFRI